MRDPSCQRALESLCLGLPDAAREHLEVCVLCREEAEGLGRVLDELAEGVELRVPQRAEAPVLNALRAAAGPCFAIKPLPAFVLGALGLGSFVTLVSFILAQTPVADAAPLAAVLLVGTYLSICAVVSLPLLLRSPARKAPTLGESRP